jgi:hypothetical protein
MNFKVVIRLIKIFKVIARLTKIFKVTFAIQNNIIKADASAAEIQKSIV